jgi:hypothetical protein
VSTGGLAGAVGDSSSRILLRSSSSPARSQIHDDYRFGATVNHSILDGNPDSEPDNDVCPREAASGGGGGLFRREGGRDRGCPLAQRGTSPEILVQTDVVVRQGGFR